MTFITVSIRVRIRFEDKNIQSWPQQINESTLDGESDSAHPSHMHLGTSSALRGLNAGLGLGLW